MECEYSIQDYRRFSEKIADFVDNYIQYSTVIDENDGVYIDQEDNISLASILDHPDRKDFFPITTLVKEEDGVTLPDYDAIDEVTSGYIFVR